MSRSTQAQTVQRIFNVYTKIKIKVKITLETRVLQMRKTLKIQGRQNLRNTIIQFENK